MILGKKDERTEAAYNGAVLTEGVVVVGHDICESIRDVTTLDDPLRLVRLVREQKEGEDDASKEEPTANTEGDVDAAVGLVLGTRVEDSI